MLRDERNGMGLVIACVLGTGIWAIICTKGNLWGSVKAFFVLWIVCMTLAIGIVNGIESHLSSDNIEISRLNGTWEDNEFQVSLCTIDRYGNREGTMLYYDNKINQTVVMIVDPKQNVIIANEIGSGYKIYKYKNSGKKLILTDKDNNQKYKLVKTKDDFIFEQN